MKKTLFWYIAREILLYFFVCFLFFFFIFFVNQILLMAEDILSKKAPLVEVVLLIFFALPAIIATSSPFAALVGSLMCLGRFVSDREILSMNALGVPSGWILVPVLCVGLLISIGSFLTNDILLPAGTIQFNQVYRRILTSTPALELESGSVKRNQNSLVISGTITNSYMDSIMVIDTDNLGNRRIITAPGAAIKSGTDPAIVMTLEMKDPMVVMMDKSVPGNYDVVRSAALKYNVLMRNIMSNYSGSITPREMSARDLSRELGLIRQQEQDERTINMYLMEFHKKFAIPFGALFFVFLAFPLALSARTNGQSVGFIVGLLFAVFYWAMLIGGQTLGLRLGYNGPVMMWIPNVVILVIACFSLFRRLFR